MWQFITKMSPGRPAAKTMSQPFRASTIRLMIWEEHRKTTIVTSDEEDLSISGFPTQERKRKVIEGTTQVTYVYKEVVEEMWRFITKMEVRSPAARRCHSPFGASTNTPYDTEEHRKTTIVTSDRKTYRLVDSQLQATKREGSLKDWPSDVRL